MQFDTFIHYLVCNQNRDRATTIKRWRTFLRPDIRSEFFVGNRVNISGILVISGKSRRHIVPKEFVRFYRRNRLNDKA